MFKSIKTGLLALIIVSTAIIAKAQKTLTEGTLVYAMEANGVKIDNKVKFNGNISNLSFQSGPASISITLDLENTLGLVAVSVPIAQMQKAAKMTKADIEAQREKEPKLSDFKATGEKQMIAGYNAEKYTFKDDKGNNYELWTTTELNLPRNAVTGSYKDVPGTVIKFSSAQGSGVLKSIKEDKVGDLSVTKIPSGYDEITYAEMMAMSGGGE